MIIIDPHLHLFNLELGDYFWLQAQNPPYWPDKSSIRQSYSQDHLQPGAKHQLVGFVHIEAGFNNTHPELELAYLEQSCDLPFRSIAYADITSANFASQVKKYQQYPSFIGIRHILDKNAQSILSHPVARENLAHLEKHQLLFEAQLSLLDSDAVELLCQQLQALPQLVVIINHAGFPPAEQQANTVSENWRFNLERLAQFSNCAIKCSGWEMSDRKWTFGWAQQVIDATLLAFGDKRVMLASNFPVSELGSNYQEIWQVYTEKLSQTAEQIQKLTYGNARDWYRF